MDHCSVCRKAAPAAYSYRHDTCGHVSHVDCIVDESNLLKCPTCLNPGVINPAMGGLIEPHTADGIDYVLNPNSKGSYIYKAVTTTLGALVNRSKGAAAVPAAKTCLELLRARVPIDEIMQKHGYGLDHMLRDGINIDDFLANGYGLTDLKKFDAFSKEGPTRALQALTIGLGATANHIRDYPGKLPFAELKALTGMTSTDVGQWLGLEFKQDDRLQCFGDKNWTLKDCLTLELDISDLRALGMQWVEHYEDLTRGLTATDVERCEKAMKITAEDLMQLISLEEEQQQQRPIAAAAVVRRKPKKKVKEPTPPPSSSSDEGDDDEEEEEEPKKIDIPIVKPKMRIPVATVAATTRYHVPPSFLHKQGKK